MCSVFRSHNPIPLSYFTTYHSILTSDTTGATGGTISQPKINKIIKCFGSTQQLVLVVRFRFKIDHCFTMTSYDGLVYYLIFHNGVFYNNIIHITTSVWRRLNVFFIITMFTLLYVRVDILLTRGNHLHDRIIALRGEVLAHNPRLTSHFLLKYMYQARKVSSQIFLRFLYLILELFGRCGIYALFFFLL